MNGRTAFSIAVLVGAFVAILLLSGVVDLGGGGDDGDDPRPAQTTAVETQTAATTPALAPATPKPERPVPAQEPLPEDPDDLPGTDDRALTRPGNLRRALRVLERERVRREGIFDDLRVAPGRIDTTIESARRSLTLQIRPDMKIPFRVDHEFPNDNDADWRKDGLGAGVVDPRVPAAMLRRIDKFRSGSAARDIDYFVIRRDIIDHTLGYVAYFNTGARPRIVRLEDDGSLTRVG